MASAFIEAFSGRFRADCLNAHWFLSLSDAHGKLEAWRRDYNEVRPHSAIGNKAADHAHRSRQRIQPAAVIDPENSTARWGQVGEQTTAQRTLVMNEGRPGGAGQPVFVPALSRDRDCGGREQLVRMRMILCPSSPRSTAARALVQPLR